MTKQSDLIYERSATFSPCRNYRYTLTRRLCSGGTVMFVLLNPSKADETEDDPTVRRCLGYMRKWKYGTLCMTNLFAFRATEPRQMLMAEDPVGPDNDEAILEASTNADLIVAAWGVRGVYRGRDQFVRELLGTRLHYLRLTKYGHPSHPLYLRRELKPKPWGHL